VEIPPDVLGFAVVIATLLGTAFGVKLLVWGKGPIRRLRTGSTDMMTNGRLDDLEERVHQLSELVTDQSQMLEEYHERLDFAERLLTRQREEQPKGLEPPQ
jgi:hypothetical protein